MCDGLYRRVLELNPRHAVIGGVLLDLDKAVAVLERFELLGTETPADVAAAIAKVEVACDLVRLMVGRTLVDLEKTEVLASLQAEVRQASEEAH